jgi:hypothetical protein
LYKIPSNHKPNVKTVGDEFDQSGLSHKCPGLWHNGDCSLLCQPARWYDILLFFVGNYLAHVATVVSRPGADITSQIINLMAALLLPFSGLGLGLEAISSLAILAPTQLRTAARAGALLMIVPT